MLSAATPRPGMTNETQFSRTRPYLSFFSFMRTASSSRVGCAGLDDVFQHQHLRAVYLPRRGLAAGKTGEPGQRGIARSIDKSIRGKFDIAIARRDIEFADAAAFRRSRCAERRRGSR